MANVHDVAGFFIDLAQKQSDHDQGDLMTNLRLQKLLYFAQGWHLAIFNQPLFEDDLQAWPYGPVVPSVYNELSRFGKSGIPSIISIQRDKFTNDEYDLLFDIAEEYGRFSTSELVGISHEKGSPWDLTPQREVISKEKIHDYFASQPSLNRFKVDMDDVYIPDLDENGIPVFPADFDDDWGNDDV